MENQNQQAQTTQPQQQLSADTQDAFFQSFSFFDVIVTIGITSIVLGLIYVGRKLQILEDLKGTVDKIKVNVKVVSDYLVKNHNKFDPAELQAYSPLKLTPQGERFIEEIGFNNVFEQNKAHFFECVESEHPKLKYDVEIAAIKSIHALYQKPFMEFLKVYLYNNPARAIENVAPTLGVYVRDKYLEAHPEITQ